MAKVISKYRAYTAAEIKARATVPDQVDMTVVSTTVECVAITTAKIRNAIGASFNAVGALNLSVLVNKWSGFGPTVRSVSAGLLVNSVGEAPHGMGEFAGYNHAAAAPDFYTSPLGVTKSIIAGEAVHWEISIDIGEPKYSNEIVDYLSSVKGIAMSLWSDDGNLLFQTKGGVECPMAEVIDIESVKSRVNFGEASGGYRLTGTNIHKIATPSTPYYGTVVTKIELIDESGDGAASDPEIASNYDPDSVICQIPGLESFNTTLRLKQANSVSITGNMSGVTFGSSGAAPDVDWDTLEVTSNGLVCSNSKSSYLRVRMWVEDYLGNTLTDVYTIRAIASGAYTADSDVIVQQSTDYDDPGSDSHDSLNGSLTRTPWTSGGVSKGAVDDYDLVLRIDFDGN